MYRNRNHKGGACQCFSGKNEFPYFSRIFPAFSARGLELVNLSLSLLSETSNRGPPKWDGSPSRVGWSTVCDIDKLEDYQPLRAKIVSLSLSVIWVSGLLTPPGLYLRSVRAITQQAYFAGGQVRIRTGSRLERVFRRRTAFTCFSSTPQGL